MSKKPSSIKILLLRKLLRRHATQFFRRGEANSSGVRIAIIFQTQVPVTDEREPHCRHVLSFL
jgi:hypothetical protein